MVQHSVNTVMPSCICFYLGYETKLRIFNLGSVLIININLPWICDIIYFKFTWIHDKMLAALSGSTEMLSYWDGPRSDCQWE